MLPGTTLEHKVIDVPEKFGLNCTDACGTRGIEGAHLPWDVTDPWRVTRPLWGLGCR